MVMARKQKKPKNRAPISAYDRAIKILSSRRNTVFEIRLKLCKRGHSEEETEATISRLLELHYLDDESSAKDWATELASFGDLSRRRAIQKLRKRGLNSDLIDEKISKVWDMEVESSHAKRAFEKALRSRGIIDKISNEEKQALWRSLYSKGFSTETIRNLISEHGEHSEESDNYSLGG